MACKTKGKARGGGKLSGNQIKSGPPIKGWEGIEDTMTTPLGHGKYYNAYQQDAKQARFLPYGPFSAKNTTKQKNKFPSSLGVAAAAMGKDSSLKKAVKKGFNINK